jgi:hypothetical protein
MATFHQKLLRDAVKLMGREHVAKALGVPKEALDSWLRGEGGMSGAELTKLARAAADFAQKNK